MSTLFLIGNGFDVNCGMKTRYTDMYFGYISSKSTSPIIEQFKNSISGDIDNWGDFEMAMAEYAGQLNSESELLECLRDFNVYLNKYLTNEQEKFKKIVSEKTISNAISSEMHQSFMNFYDGITHNLSSLMQGRNAVPHSSISVISFNYTDAFDYLFSKHNAMFGGNRNVIHIHGKLNDDPFMGVDNINQIKNTYPLSNKGMRTFIKPISNEAYDKKRVEVAKNLIKNADTICAFGVSLGESDLTWRNELVNWIKENSENHLFIFKHSLFKENYGTVMERLDRGDSVREQLLLDWGVQFDEAESERIHIPCGKPLFSIKEIIDDAERKAEEAKKVNKLIEEHGDVIVSEI